MDAFTWVLKPELNDAFVIDQDKRDELIEEDPRSAELIKALATWPGHQAVEADWPCLYIIFASRGVDIDQYPAIRDHLSWFRMTWRNGLQHTCTRGTSFSSPKKASTKNLVAPRLSYLILHVQ